MYADARQQCEILRFAQYSIMTGLSYSGEILLRTVQGMHSQMSQAHGRISLLWKLQAIRAEIPARIALHDIPGFLPILEEMDRPSRSLALVSLLAP